MPARLLELFTIGKRPDSWSGDYTNYTEEDVLAIAKVWTGWTDMSFRSPNLDVVTSTFRPNQHDTGTKKLESQIQQCCDQQWVPKNIVLIDTIFQQEEVSKFIARKLYRWFVYYQIDDSIESAIIEPL